MVPSLFCGRSKLHDDKREGGEVLHHFVLDVFVKRSSSRLLSVSCPSHLREPIPWQSEVCVRDAAAPALSLLEGSPKVFLAEYVSLSPS